jgi:lipopolysaccharide biosynthesis protein
MATNIGKDGAVYVGSNAVAEIKEWSLETTSEVADDTVMGDSWMTHTATQKSWTASFTAFWDPTDTNGQQALTEGASITLNLYPTGNNSGDYEWTGTATITSVSKSASFDGFVEASFSAQGNGALVEGTV